MQTKKILDTEKTMTARQAFRGKSFDDEENDVDNKLVDIIKKYFVETSIHGLKYIFEVGRFFVERLYWIIACITLWSIGFYLIYQIIDKWQTSPVMVSFDSSVTPIWNIPYPAVTICNMNKVRKSRKIHVDDERAANPSVEKWKTEQLFIEEVCATHSKKAAEGDHSSEEEEDLNISGSEVHEFLADLAHPCNEMLLRCHFAGNERNCSEIFHPTITDEGECCSFNLMPESLLLREEVVLEEDHVSEDEKARWSGWSPEEGYDSPAQIHAKEDLTNEKLPRRSTAPGLHMGLTMLLNVQKNDYYCSGTESVGFKGLLHTPSENPELVEYGFAITPGTENFMPIKPEVIHADTRIHSIDHLKRQCFLNSERNLRFYSHYSYLNCFMECAANYTFKQCDCVSYYMPRDAYNMPICAPSKSACVDEALETVEAEGFDHAGPVAECECLPGCTETKYPFSLSTSKISRAEGLHLSDELKTDNPDLANDDYVEENVAILHIYHNDLHFLKRERGELFSFVDLFSYIGGVLGLCLGFSAMSCLECIYFFTLRLGLNVRYNRDEPDVGGSLSLFAKE